MKTISYVLIFLLVCSGYLARAQQKIWPGGRRAVIVLTYDDALNTQADVALPQLRAAGLKATFFLTGYMGTKNIVKWRKAAKDGYELANHTIFHPCSGLPDYSVHAENYSVEAMISEIRVMNTFLYTIDPQCVRTYAYPCMDTLAGGRSYVPALKNAGVVRYGRLGGDTEAVITDVKKLDKLRVPAYAVDAATPGRKLIAFVKEAERKRGLGIFVFHGIGGDYISTSVKAHRQLLNYLRAHRRSIWVTTFRQAMDQI